MTIDHCIGKWSSKFYCQLLENLAQLEFSEIKFWKILENFSKGHFFKIFQNLYWKIMIVSFRNFPMYWKILENLLICRYNTIYQKIAVTTGTSELFCKIQ